MEAEDIIGKEGRARPEKAKLEEEKVGRQEAKTALVDRSTVSSIDRRWPKSWQKLPVDRSSISRSIDPCKISEAEISCRSIEHQSIDRLQVLDGRFSVVDQSTIMSIDRHCCLIYFLANAKHHFCGGSHFIFFS